MQKPIFITANIVKGEAERVKSVERYNDDGNPVRDTTLFLGEHQFTLFHPRNVSISSGDKVILEFASGENGNRVLSGINTSLDQQWGDAPRKLRTHITPADALHVARGKVTEKQMKDDLQLASDTFAAGVSMRLRINDKLYGVPIGFGKRVNIGDEVGVVEFRKAGRTVLYRNYTTGERRRVFPVYYLGLVLLAALLAGCGYAYAVGRIDRFGALFCACIATAFMLFNYFGSRAEYRMRKQADEFLNATHDERSGG